MGSSPPSLHRATPLRVLIADEQRRDREDWLARLATGTSVEVVGWVDDADALEDAFQRLRPDVVVVDPSVTGLDAEPSPRVTPRAVVFINDATDAELTRLVDAGIRGFARRESVDLGSVVQAVGEGGIAVGSGLADRLAPLLLEANLRRIEAGASLELAREALLVQVQELRETNASLEMARESLAAQLDELLETYHETVRALASAVELRDEYTGGHIERVAAYALAIAREFDPALTDDPSVLGYMLHDIGKLALPDELLFNTGTLTAEQFEVVKTHTLYGARLVEGIPFLQPALRIVRNHHERWDGHGYPDGLAGEGIPDIVRVFTLADSLDAITTDRPYQDARSLEAALEDIEAGAGSQFAPAVVEAFLAVVEDDPSFALLRDGMVPGSSRRISEPRPQRPG